MSLLAMIITVLFACVQIFIEGMALQFVFIAMMVVSLLWWGFKKMNTLQYKIKSLNEEKAKMVAEHYSLSLKNENYESLFHSLDGAVFSINMVHQTVTFSKGIEQIYGYSDELYRDNRHIWKERLHQEDYERIANHERKIVAGQTSQVEYRIIHAKTNQIRWLNELVTPMKTSYGVILRLNGHITDITEQKRAEVELKQLAYYDDVTDLPNRKALHRHLKKALARSKRNDHSFVIMFIDLDGFKNVNDTMGHEAGDQLLKEVSVRINECIREEDLVSRIGGDEFVVVFEETAREEVEKIAKRLLKHVALPYMIHEKEANISLSIGISVYPNDGETKEVLLEHADQAMYCAKQNGKNGYVMYKPELNEMDFKKVSVWDRWIDSIQKSKLFN
ncbi:diguanylate cyclase domain-containing protein [Metabacillus iocasae]|uniref:Diguanylate cyclase (GGDEF)-like protein/PAS domain S-box-containing protein n=1 Tax=Priestia iocasae TaxID=2291674 RepID=A0ABS2QY52_9BACI|nr:diguanylate cyclase (GGDEF)-like protein/PAS domain S-box-containing protein [Metabacillus iocasae]